MELLSSSIGLIEAPLLYTGKVRELYQMPEKEQMLIVTTDRISAFDHVLQPPIPYKGEVLTQLAAYWFKQIEHIIPHHMLAASEIPALVSQALRPRSMLVKRCERIPIECVIRGYLAGNGWRQYQVSGAINGVAINSGLQKNEVLPEPIFTPAIKNDNGHDEDISFEQLCNQVGNTLAQQLREVSLALYNFAWRSCQQREVILVDCKFEFGWCDGRLTLIDEIFTPDSARFWPFEHYYLPTNNQLATNNHLPTEIPSWDKEPLRHYLAKHYPQFIAPQQSTLTPEEALLSEKSVSPEQILLPADIVQQTSANYLAIYQRLTSHSLISTKR